MARKVLANLVCEWHDSGMFDSYLIEGFETVHNVERLAVLLDDAEPLRPIG